MTEKTIIMDASTLNNLYYGGGKQAWDKILDHYDNVVIPDAINVEMTRFVGSYDKDDDFVEWRDNKKSKIIINDTEIYKNTLSKIEELEEIKTLTKKERKELTDNLGEKAIAETADDMMKNKGVSPIIASDERNFFAHANATQQVEEIKPIKTPEIMKDMLDKNTIKPREYQDWADNSDISKNSQFKKEDFLDLSKPYDRTIERMDAAREIRKLEPKAKAEADQALEAALKDTSPEAAAKVARAEKEKDWVDREGTASVLHEKLAGVGDTFTVRVEPGATSIGQLQALSNGIDAEVVRQQQEQARAAEQVRSAPEAGKPAPGAERSGPERER